MRDKDEVILGDVFRFHIGDHVIYVDDNGYSHKAVIVDRDTMYHSPVYFIECKGKEPFYVPEACVHQ